MVWSVKVRVFDVTEDVKAYFGRYGLITKKPDPKSESGLMHNNLYFIRLTG